MPNHGSSPPTETQDRAAHGLRHTGRPCPRLVTAEPPPATRGDIPPGAPPVFAHALPFADSDPERPRRPGPRRSAGLLPASVYLADLLERIAVEMEAGG